MKKVEHLEVVLMTLVGTTFDCWLARLRGKGVDQPPPRARCLFLAAFFIFSNGVAGAMMEELVVLVVREKCCIRSIRMPEG